MHTVYARDVMKGDVLAVRTDMTARQAAAFLTEHQIAGAPVLDEAGHLVGVLSATDLVENEADDAPFAPPGSRDVRRWEGREDVLVRDIMTPTVYTVPEDTPVAEIARTMIAGRIHRLFVTRDRHVVGIVTPMDLLALLAERSPE